MPLTEEESLERLAEALYLSRTELPPEVHAVVSIALDNLRYFRMLCQSENLTLNEITPAIVIQKLAGCDVTNEDLFAAKKEIEEKGKCGQTIKL